MAGGGMFVGSDDQVPAKPDPVETGGGTVGATTVVLTALLWSGCARPGPVICAWFTSGVPLGTLAPTCTENETEPFVPGASVPRLNWSAPPLSWPPLVAVPAKVTPAGSGSMSVAVNGCVPVFAYARV